MACRFDGKSKLLSFGEYPAVSLKDAGECREEAKRMLSKGLDPSDHKRQLRQARVIAERAPSSVPARVHSLRPAYQV